MEETHSHKNITTNRLNWPCCQLSENDSDIQNSVYGWWREGLKNTENKIKSAISLLLHN